MTIPTDSAEERFRALAASAQELVGNLFAELPAHDLDPATVLAGLTATLETREKFADLQARYYRRWLEIWSDIAADTDSSDRRFEADEWQELPWFRILRRAYDVNARYLEDLAALAQLDTAAKRKLQYLTQQLIDAMAPTNFPATNPEAIRQAMRTGGTSIAQGLKLLSRDLARGRIAMTDESAFEVGGNLAVTPGDVVFENELVQLIQYRASTPEVHERPLLIIPPFINKYYILDLQPDNSFVRYCVDQGFTTFIVSWRNVSESLSHLTWDDYMELGVFAPIKAVREITGSLTVNTLGFCVGGTLLACALAVLAARKRKPVHSLSLLATMLDFSDTGDISVYVDRKFVEQTEAEYGQGGLIPGARLAATFAMLRANELVWHFVINNYLLGQTPRAFDLLYWNGDGSNLPGPLYAYYLRNMYLENNLRVPGKLRMKGSAVDLGAIRIPAYVVATREDHIVPWKTAYASARLLGGRTDFVLGASGHVAGIVNAPSQNRRHYWTGGAPAGDPESWLAGAKQTKGSWWPHWCQWLANESGELKPASRLSGSKRYPVIEPAPGRYVLSRNVGTTFKEAAKHDQ